MADEIVIGKIGLTPKGEYVSGELYEILDVVSNDGNSYISRIAENDQPLTNADAWMLSAEKGEEGLSIKGDKGDTFTFEDLTTEQKEELKGDVIVYNSLDEADKDDLASRVPITGVVEEGNTQAVSGGEVYDKFKEIGVSFENNGFQNIAEPLINEDLENNSVWFFGIFLQDGSPTNISGWSSIRLRQPVNPGVLKSNLYFTGNANFVTYDSNDEVVRTISDLGNIDGTLEWSIDIMENEKSIRYSKARGSEFSGYIMQEDTPLIVTDEVFALKADLDGIKEDVMHEVDSEFKNFGFEKIGIGFNFLQELTVSDYTNEDIWGQNAFLTNTGSLLTGQADFYYTKKYYEINGGIRFRFRNRYNGNAKCLIYDKDKNIIQVLENLTSTWIQDVFITTPENAKYIRLSMRGDYTDTILLTNEEAIYNSVKVEVSDDIKTTNINAVSGKGVADNFVKNNTLISLSKTKAPVVTFISDDGRAGNLTWYLPMLEANNCRSTFAVVGSWLDGGMGYTIMTREDILECKSKGHDIASHTLTHPNLSNITIEEADLELYKSRLILNEIGIDCPMFVSPFGGRNINVDRVVRKYYNANFISVADSQVTNGTCVNHPIIDRFNLKRVSFDAAANGVSRLQICKDAVDVLLSQGGWLVFAIHPHYPEYLQSGNPDGYEARRQELQDLITYIRSKDINILPANKAYDFYKNQIQIGDLRLDNEHYIIGSDLTIDNTMY